MPNSPGSPRGQCGGRAAHGRDTIRFQTAADKFVTVARQNPPDHCPYQRRPCGMRGERGQERIDEADWRACGCDRRQHGRPVGRAGAGGFFRVVTVLERDAFPRRGHSAQGRAAGPPRAWPAGARPQRDRGFLSRLDRRGRRLRRRPGRHRRRRQLDRPWRYHEVRAERSGRPAGVAPGAGRPCAAPAAGAAECARDRELRGAGPCRRDDSSHDQRRSRQDRQRCRADHRGRPRGRCRGPRIVEPGLA